MFARCGIEMHWKFVFVCFLWIRGDLNAVLKRFPKKALVCEIAEAWVFRSHLTSSIVVFSRDPAAGESGPSLEMANPFLIAALGALALLALGVNAGFIRTQICSSCPCPVTPLVNE